MAYRFIPSRMLFGLLALGIHLAAGADCDKRPSKISPLSCCSLPDIITEEVMEKCKKSMPPPLSPLPTAMQGSDLSNEMSDKSKPHPPGPPHGRHHHHRPHGPPMHSCFLSCVLNETGIMMPGPDAKLNEEKLSAYLKIALVNDTNMIPSMETSFKTCAVKGEEIRSKIKEKMQKKNTSSTNSDSSMTQDRMLRPPHHQCSPIAGHLMRCVFKESVINCPASIWSNTNECNEMRDFMKNCKPKFNDKPGMYNSVEEM